MASVDIEALRAARVAALDLSKRNWTFKDIDAALRAQGFDDDTTRTTLRHIVDEAIAEREAQARRNIFYGLWIAGAGVLVFVATLATATFQGGYIIISWGAVGIGLLWMAQGFWLRYSAGRYRAQGLYKTPPTSTTQAG